MDHHLHTSNGAVPQTIMGAPFGCNTPPATAEHAIDAQMDKFFPNIFDHVSEESSSLDSQCFLSGLDGTHHSTSLDTTMNGHDNSITSRDESSESGESLQNTPVTEQQVCSYRNSGPKKSSTSKPNPFPEIDMSFIMGESSMALCSYIPPAGLDSDTEAMSYLPKTTPNDVKRQIEQFCAKLNLHVRAFPDQDLMTTNPLGRATSPRPQRGGRVDSVYRGDHEGLDSIHTPHP